MALKPSGYEPIRSTNPKSTAKNICGCLSDIQWYNDPFGFGVPTESIPPFPSSESDAMEHDAEKVK